MSTASYANVSPEGGAIVVDGLRAFVAAPSACLEASMVSAFQWVDPAQPMIVIESRARSGGRLERGLGAVSLPAQSALMPLAVVEAEPNGKGCTCPPKIILRSDHGDGSCTAARLHQPSAGQLERLGEVLQFSFDNLPASGPGEVVEGISVDRVTPLAHLSHSPSIGPLHLPRHGGWPLGATRRRRVATLLGDHDGRPRMWLPHLTGLAGERHYVSRISRTALVWTRPGAPTGFHTPDSRSGAVRPLVETFAEIRSLFFSEASLGL